MKRLTVKTESAEYAVVENFGVYTVVGSSGHGSELMNKNIFQPTIGEKLKAHGATHGATSAVQVIALEGTLTKSEMVGRSADNYLATFNGRRISGIAIAPYNMADEPGKRLVNLSLVFSDGSGFNLKARDAVVDIHNVVSGDLTGIPA